LSGKQTIYLNKSGIKRAFGVPESSNQLEIRNRTWYYDRQVQTWGAVGHSFLRDFFKGVLKLSSVYNNL